jgi:hypothetical protein
MGLAGCPHYSYPFACHRANVHAHPFANIYRYDYSVPHSHSNPFADTHCHEHLVADTHCHEHLVTDTHCYEHLVAHTHGDSITYTYIYMHVHPVGHG